MLTPEQIKEQLKNGEITLSEWCRTVFQELWNKRYCEELKIQEKPNVYLYNPTWMFDEMEERHKKVTQKIREDTKFLDSITHPYGIKWSHRNDNILFSTKEEKM